MKITFVSGDYARLPRGGPRVVYEYASRLAARGHDVAVVHPRKIPLCYPTFYRRARRKLGEIRDLLLKPRLTWQPVSDKVKMLYVSDLSPRNIPDGDAVFATAWHTVSCVLESPPQKGEKFYLIQGYETWAGPKEAVDATWRAPLHKVVVATWLQDIGKELGCTDIVRIPNGIEHEIFRVTNPIGGRSPRVAFLYSPDISKGAEDALEALIQAKNANQELQAVYFGTFPRPRSIPGWIEYYRNPQRIELAEKIYNGSSIFLSASRSEGFPLSPAEAMACGCVLVSTDIPGVHDYAENGTTALLAPVGNPQAIAEGILQLLKSDELRTRLALAGRQRVQEFSWERSTDLLEEFLAEQLSVGIGR